MHIILLQLLLVQCVHPKSIYEFIWNIFVFPRVFLSLIPRVYPMAFARAFLDLFEKLKANSSGQPELPAGGAPPCLETLQMEWRKDEDLWGFADFGELFRYLRGSTRLKIPEHFRGIIPRTLWWRGFLICNQGSITKIIGSESSTYKHIVFL